MNFHQAKSSDGSDLSNDKKTENSRLKQTLLQLGVPESEMNRDPEEFIPELEGLECYVQVFVRTSDDGDRKFSNVGKISLVNE